MKNHEIQTLVHRKGLDNYVTLKGSDVQRLLDLQQPYDFCMKFVQEVANYEWNDDVAKEQFAEHGAMLKRSWDRVCHGSMPAKTVWAMLRLAAYNDAAKTLVMFHPKPSWDNPDDK